MSRRLHPFERQRRRRNPVPGEASEGTVEAPSDVQAAPEPAMQFGIELPHFGSLASAQGTIDLARRAEELGFDSVAGGRLAPRAF